ncbi:MAG: CDP-glucose 4,6-dehydratase [Synergistaceae bacterium]|nr:CDP-glucose 4,6-dehydratase [Synergistaceae bacterium]
MKSDFWRGKRVFITGHTGFKGLWLAKWLDMSGAVVTGYSLPPDEYSLYEKVSFGSGFSDSEGDVRDLESLKKAMRAAEPEIAFHLAAQAIVGTAWKYPAETFATNVMGTVNFLESIRETRSVKAAIAVTSDKVYENAETARPYDETDRLGGDEPYAASKTGAEMAVIAYRNAYFKTGPECSAVRASNAYGGGDLHYDRLIPHLIKAKVIGETPELRSPDAVRPWQYVLDLLNGYLAIAEAMYGGSGYSECWNFGPPKDEIYRVGDIYRLIMSGKSLPKTERAEFNESNLLLLDSSKSESRLGWKPKIKLEDGLNAAYNFYLGMFGGESAGKLMERDIASYTAGLP